MDRETSSIKWWEKYQDSPSIIGVDWGKGLDETVAFTELDYRRMLDYLREKGKMPYTSDELDNIFTYHAPVGDQVERYKRIREAAKNLAQVIVDNTTPSPEQTLAVREVEIACMRANQCVALRG